MQKHEEATARTSGQPASRRQATLEIRESRCKGLGGLILQRFTIFGAGVHLTPTTAILCNASNAQRAEILRTATPAAWIVSPVCEASSRISSPATQCCAHLDRDTHGLRALKRGVFDLPWVGQQLRTRQHSSLISDTRRVGMFLGACAFYRRVILV